MSETIIQLLQKYNIAPELIIFIISMLPILEIRGGLIAASILNIPIIKAFFICFLGNILPIPFILLFIKKIFELLKRFRLFRGIITYLEEKSVKKSESIQNRQMLGLLAFVGIPLPGTGGWTGALIASLLNMPVKKTFPTIAAGILFAGCIMIIVAYFIPGFFGF